MVHRTDTAFTGHVASPYGDIRVVGSLPAKLDAAVADGTVEQFVCPALDADTSLATLARKQRQEALVAFARAREHLRVTQVADVHQLLRAVLADESIVLAALRTGFFSTPPSEQALDGTSIPVHEAASFLAGENEPRFWRSLETCMMAGETAQARRLLAARLRHQLRRREYPQGLGFRLLQLVRSLPRATRRLKFASQWLPVDLCVGLWELAHEGDTDYQFFMEAVLRREMGGPGMAGTPVTRAETATVADSAKAGVDLVLEQLSAETLAREIDLPIDTARGAYTLENPVAESSEASMDTLTAFHLFLLRHDGSVPGSVDGQAVAKDALALLERAFARDGGVSAAIAEALHPTRGGQKWVLDVVTEHYKAEQRAKHVSRVIREAIDPLDWDARVAFTAALLERLGPQLPNEVREQPAERFAPRVEQFIETYARSFDRVRDLLRSL